MLLKCRTYVIIFYFQIFLKFLSGYKTNSELIQHLKDEGYIHSQEVESIMLSIDRGHFIQYDSYDDSPKDIGFSVTISAPHMHAVALEHILPKLNSGASILDVGSGSGYLTACFMKKIGAQGIVVGIDHIEELVQKSISSINKIPEIKEYLYTGKLHLKTGDGREGFKDFAPYDAIHVGAASETIPENLVSQLKIDGILICPVGKPGNQYLTKITKLSDGSLREEKLMAVRYVLLTDKSAQLRSDL